NPSFFFVFFFKIEKKKGSLAIAKLLIRGDWGWKARARGYSASIKAESGCRDLANGLYFCF
ncbi:hypothetical protein, partial [Fictibacillus sp. 26RED30]|uniref:hypothetical protein n=1 Tax=Fictibacillus sp. 26RED30 TaxID=2745877 RepID=UPI001E37954C